jgi:hypothetical protein
MQALAMALVVFFLFFSVSVSVLLVYLSWSIFYLMLYPLLVLTISGAAMYNSFLWMVRLMQNRPTIEQRICQLEEAVYDDGAKQK